MLEAVIQSKKKKRVEAIMQKQKQFTEYDLYYLARAECLMQKYGDKAISIWDFLDDEFEDKFNLLELSDQEELMKKASSFAKEQAKNFAIIENLQAEEFLYEKDYVARIKSLMLEVIWKIQKEFSAYL